MWKVSHCEIGGDDLNDLKSQLNIRDLQDIGEPHAGHRFHGRSRIRMPEAGHSGQDPSQRGGSQSVRTGSRVRGVQPGQRPQPAVDDHHGQDRPPS